MSRCAKSEDASRRGRRRPRPSRRVAHRANNQQTTRGARSGPIAASNAIRTTRMLSSTHRYAFACIRRRCRRRWLRGRRPGICIGQRASAGFDRPAASAWQEQATWQKRRAQSGSADASFCSRRQNIAIGRDSATIATKIRVRACVCVCACVCRRVCARGFAVARARARARLCVVRCCEVRGLRLCLCAWTCAWVGAQMGTPAALLRRRRARGASIMHAACCFIMHVACCIMHVACCKLQVACCTTPTQTRSGCVHNACCMLFYNACCMPCCIMHVACMLHVASCRVPVALLRRRRARGASRGRTPRSCIPGGPVPSPRGSRWRVHTVTQCVLHGPRASMLRRPASRERGPAPSRGDGGRLSSVRRTLRTLTECSGVLGYYNHG